MTETTSDSQTATGKPLAKTLIFGLILGLLGAGGGFYLVSTGVFPKRESDAAPAAKIAVEELPDLAFIPVDPIVVSLPPDASARHLRFRAELEVAAAHSGDVKLILPRIVDVMNGYLRALRISDLRAPEALSRIRTHLLRRIQVVAGEGRVRDVLVMEFVLN